MRHQTRAVNQTVLSDTLYAQTLTGNYQGNPHAIRVDITFITEKSYGRAVVEAITAYTPMAFSRFWLFDLASGTMQPDPEVEQRMGEQFLPVVVSTADGTSALGILSLTQEPQPRYGRFIFSNTSKWNLVFRPTDRYPAGEHHYACVIFIGSLQEVSDAMLAFAAGVSSR